MTKAAMVVPRASGDGVIAVLSGDWIAREGTGATLDLAGVKTIAFDTAAIGQWDSALLVFATAQRLAAREMDIGFDDTGLPEAARKLLALTEADVPDAAAQPDRGTAFSRTGQAVMARWADMLSVVEITGETILRGGAALTGRARMRRTDLLACAYEAGASALAIVTVVNVLVGGILAFVGAVQLRKFGADIYIAALVGVAVVREMAGLMTAIVMSGRTGGAYAAHIATMLGNEEIDALRAFGIPVHDYLVLPRVIALTVMMPLLYLYGCAVGIAGGFIVAVAMLNLSPETFVDQTRQSVGGEQIVFGLVKSVAFGVLIAIAGCRSGLRAGRSAADVGKAATSAVVIGIVGVIALDALFAVCANALDF